jgi:anti-sigma-K factor RskA
MDCQEFEALSGAYTLDAITDDERREADAHLAQCPKCQRIVRELQSVVNFLPLSVPPVEPSSHLKKRLFATIHHEAPRNITPPQPQRSWWRRWDTRLLVAVAALLCILFVGMLAWNLSLQRQLALQPRPVSSPITYTLHSATGTANVTGELIYFPQLHLTALIMRGLPPLQGKQVYQGWLLTNKHPKSLGLLHMQDESAILNFSGNVKGYDTVAVSIESGPQASPNSPRGEVVAVGLLNHSQ